MTEEELQDHVIEVVSLEEIYPLGYFHIVDIENDEEL